MRVTIWMVLFGAAVLGLMVGLAFIASLLPASASWVDPVVTVGTHLGPSLVAFVIGTRVRSWDWIVGPLGGWGWSSWCSP